jgi:phosphoenolpyruvate carboxykinase (GTP)
LFKQHLNTDYTKEEYNEQFAIRISKYLEKMDRMTEAFSHIQMPPAFATELENQIKRLQAAKAVYGEVATPDKFQK